MGLFGSLFSSPQDRFARQVLAVLRDAGVAEARYVPHEFAIHVRRDPAEDAPVVAYLGNLFRECRGTGREERRARIARHLAVVVFPSAPPDSWEAAAPLLRPLLRTATFGLGMPAGGPTLVRRPTLPFLDEVVAVDQPTSMMYVTTSHLAQWGVPASTVHARARANLTTVPFTDSGGSALIRMVDDGDAYWASHLLVDGWLAALAPRVGGRPVAFVPDTTGLLLTADGSGLGPLFALVEEQYREAARPISPMAYTVDDTGAVVPYPAPPGHPLHAAAHRAEVLLAAAEYESQGQFLDTEAFAAELVVAGRPDGSVFSVASWPRDVDTLLPVADYVSLAADGEPPWFVTWDTLSREVDLVRSEHLNPPRHRLRSWPHPAVVARLRAAAATP